MNENENNHKTGNSEKNEERSSPKANDKPRRRFPKRYRSQTPNNSLNNKHTDNRQAIVNSADEPTTHKDNRHDNNTENNIENQNTTPSQPPTPPRKAMDSRNVKHVGRQHRYNKLERNNGRDPVSPKNADNPKVSPNSTGQRRTQRTDNPKADNLTQRPRNTKTGNSFVNSVSKNNTNDRVIRTGNSSDTDRRNNNIPTNRNRNKSHRNRPELNPNSYESSPNRRNGRFENTNSDSNYSKQVYGIGESGRSSTDNKTSKTDSLIPAPFYDSNSYYGTGQETSGYEEMTNDQLTFLKNTSIDDEIADDCDVDFVIPDNAVLMDVVGIRIHHADPVLMFDSRDVHLEKGDRVVVETKKGLSLGDVLLGTRRQYVKQHNLPRIIRKMSHGDYRQEERSKDKEKIAYDLCKERIESLRLSMKLVEVEYLHGGNKAVFYFSADGRIDFRELVRDLAQRLHTRIEMRQIGVRDVARIVGGIGICGCRLCCNLYLREFKPISIRMAKDQNLVLNPQKVSGVCGRLLCCLTYENEVYQDAARSMPRIGRTVKTPDGEGRIRDRDVLKRTVRVQVDDETILREYRVDQIVLKTGNDDNDDDNFDNGFNESSLQNRNETTWPEDDPGESL